MTGIQLGFEEVGQKEVWNEKSVEGIEPDAQEFGTVLNTGDTKINLIFQ